MRYLKPLVPCLLGFIFLLNSKEFFQLTLVNGLGQLCLFLVVVCIPIWRTGRMSYVDIGWPWGLVLLGVTNYYLNEGYWLRSLIVSAALIAVGLRMGLGALNLWRLGYLSKEFPRYQYQRIRWDNENKENVALALQVDAISQGLANTSFLALPIFVIASNKSLEISVFEIVGLVVWFMAFLLESIADFQKTNFLREMKKTGRRQEVCNIGLWRYCRHPNYFFEWMVWNGFVIASIPSWLSLKSEVSSVAWYLLALALLFTSRLMYTTLVYETGAVPSEYFSLEKRPGYKRYQETTNRFFPGPVRPSLSE